ncbi:hypothetical protein J2S74_001123 [Evansella vedderi]|uniref:Uncharacterized protein n=1 Tax=Evansella vedderi TaxID=38282 RepID=A0ABT9ZSP5_9BACI|nr:hypothetical protein [Evansella vedderi]MDQ0253751.1 hypothetical protein [Evansella vedderi]
MKKIFLIISLVILLIIGIVGIWEQYLKSPHQTIAEDAIVFVFGDQIKDDHNSYSMKVTAEENRNIIEWFNEASNVRKMNSDSFPMVTEGIYIDFPPDGAQEDQSVSEVKRGELIWLTNYGEDVFVARGEGNYYLIEQAELHQFIEEISS